MLVLAACTPATLSGFFAPCPEPTAEEWAAYQEEWLTAEWTDDPAAFEPGESQ